MHTNDVFNNVSVVTTAPPAFYRVLTTGADGGGSTNPAPGRYMYTKYVSGTKAAFVFRLTSNFSDQKAATHEKHSAHVHARILFIYLHVLIFLKHFTNVKYSQL